MKCPCGQQANRLSSCSGGTAIAHLGSPVESRPGPVRATMGQMDHGPFDMTMGPDGARAGIGWAALARTNPMVPMVARTNPAWDQAGLAIWAKPNRSQ